MAKSIQTVNGHHATFNDLDLLLVIRMLLSSMTEGDKKKLTPTVEVWENAIAMHAPGVIDLRVQEWANDEEARIPLITLFANLESSLGDWGDEIPLVHLKEDCRIPGVVFEGPYPTRHLAGAACQLRQLLAHGRQPK